MAARQHQEDFRIVAIGLMTSQETLSVPDIKLLQASLLCADCQFHGKL